MQQSLQCFGRRDRAATCSRAIGRGRPLELIGIIPCGNGRVAAASAAGNKFYAVERSIGAAAFAYLGVPHPFAGGSHGGATFSRNCSCRSVHAGLSGACPDDRARHDTPPSDGKRDDWRTRHRSIRPIRSADQPRAVVAFPRPQRQGHRDHTSSPGSLTQSVVREDPDSDAGRLRAALDGLSAGKQRQIRRRISVRGRPSCNKCRRAPSIALACGIRPGELGFDKICESPRLGRHHAARRKQGP